MVGVPSGDRQSLALTVRDQDGLEPRLDTGSRHHQPSDGAVFLVVGSIGQLDDGRLGLVSPRQHPHEKHWSTIGDDSTGIESRRQGLLRVFPFLVGIGPGQEDVANAVRAVLYFGNLDVVLKGQGPIVAVGLVVLADVIDHHRIGLGPTDQAGGAEGLDHRETRLTGVRRQGTGREDPVRVLGHRSVEIGIGQLGVGEVVGSVEFRFCPRGPWDGVGLEILNGVESGVFPQPVPGPIPAILGVTDREGRQGLVVEIHQPAGNEFRLALIVNTDNAVFLGAEVGVAVGRPDASCAGDHDRVAIGEGVAAVVLTDMHVELHRRRVPRTAGHHQGPLAAEEGIAQVQGLGILVVGHEVTGIDGEEQQTVVVSIRSLADPGVVLAHRLSVVPVDDLILGEHELQTYRIGRGETATARPAAAQQIVLMEPGEHGVGAVG